MNYSDIIHFWYKEIPPRNWFIKDLDFDTLLKRRFADIHQRAAAGELESWRQKPLGKLAEIIILDQFSRNLFRDSPKAFAYDSQALVLAQTAIKEGADTSLSTNQKSFLYMPFMHSESVAIHEQAVKLFNQPGLENNYDFELKHKVIIDRFGRYPHRNDVLGRASTPEELEFLSGPGSSF
ncbi:MAG: DUF924 domain-containing protein [Gammaproteobacteria bacterium]|nr:DUF924 domain-containing protein [Gammaproteobacteria bacterium]